MFSVASRTDPEVDVGLGDAQVSEEVFGHRPVVVLPGVDQPAQELGPPAELVHQRCNFDEIGARTGHDENAEGARRGAAVVDLHGARNPAKAAPSRACS